MSKPTIVILSAFLSPFRSGAEACAEEVPLRLQDRFDFVIVTSRMRKNLPKEDLLAGKIRVVRVGIGYPIDKWLYPFLSALEARKHRPVIIHAVLETFAGLALMLCRWTMPHAKRFLTCQTTNRRFLKGPIVRSPDAVTAISNFLAEDARKRGRSDVEVIPNGIDLGKIQMALQTQQRIPGRILFVGRLEKMKGVDVLLRAFATLLSSSSIPRPLPPPAFAKASAGRREEGVTSVTLTDTKTIHKHSPSLVGLGGEEGGRKDIHLRIVGDGSQRAALEALSRELGIADRVTFAGRVPADRIAEEYAQADVFCALSRHEALGNVFLEAQAAGCVILASDVEGIKDIVDAEHRIAIDASTEAIVDGLQACLTNEEMRKNMRNNASRIAEQYDWTAIAERYVAVYSRLLS